MKTQLEPSTMPHQLRVTACKLSFLAVLWMAIAPAVCQTPDNLVCFQTEFDSGSLDPALRIVRERSSYWSLAERPGYLRIKSQHQSLNGYPGGDVENIVLASCASGDFIAQTRLDINASLPYQSGGLTVYEDDDHFLKLTFGFNSYGGARRLLQFYSQSGSNTQFENAFTDSESIHLQVMRSRDTYSGYFSVDGTNYTLIARYSNVLTNAGVGFLTENGNIPSATYTPANADFDFLRITRLPILDIRVSEVEVCWDTVTNVLYQLMYRESLSTNEWLPLGGPVRGTGARLCTSDTVLPGQPKRLYQVVVPNAP